MSFLLALAGGALGAGLNAIFGGPEAPKPVPQPTRDDTQKLVEQNDALARRKGAAADILTGAAGAEAAPGTTGRLVLGS